MRSDPDGRQTGSPVKIAECLICKEAKEILAKGLCRRGYNRESYRKHNPDSYKKKELTLQTPEEKKARKRRNSLNSRYYRKYGIAPEEYLKLLNDQDGKCLACGFEGPLGLDHDHTTGKIRCFLCRPCNLLLGQIEKKPEAVDRLKELLEKWNSSTQ